jgi:hypothetical protein
MRPRGGDDAMLNGEAAVLAFADEHPAWRDTMIELARTHVAAYGGHGLETGDLAPVAETDESEAPGPDPTEAT